MITRDDIRFSLELMDIRPGDTLLMLADVKRGIAIPPKTAFDTFSMRVFGEEAE